MQSPELILLPSDLELEPFEVTLDETISSMNFTHHEATANSHPIIRGNIEADYIKGVEVKANIYGYIRIKCLITGVKYHIPMVAAEGYTIHSVNNAALIQALGKRAGFVVVAITENMYIPSPSGGKQLFVENGRMVNFVPDFMEVALVASKAECVPIHVFWAGNDTIPSKLFHNSTQNA